MTQAHPLQWPEGRPRTPHRERAKFQVSLVTARDGLMDELRLMGARRGVWAGKCMAPWDWRRSERN